MPMTLEDLRESLAESPFNVFCGFRIIDVRHDDGLLEMRMPFRSELERAARSGQFHGGPIASLIDTAACYAAMMMLGHGVPTIDLHVDYLRPAVSDELKAIASVRRIGRSISLVDVNVEEASGKLLAVGRCVFSSKAG